MQLPYVGNEGQKEIDENPVISGSDLYQVSGWADYDFGESILRGPFGTREKPVKVVSWYDSRIVGCMGGPGEHEHDILWHEVRLGKPLICLECGQWFELEEHPMKSQQHTLLEHLPEETRKKYLKSHDDDHHHH